MNALATVDAVQPITTREDQIKALAAVFGAEYAEEFQDPVVFKWYVFESPAVKQFYKREFPLISRTLFVESVYRRRPTYDQLVLDSFAALSAKKLGDILQMITTQCERLVKLCKTNGQMTDAAYLHPQTTLVPIIASHANTYIRCLVKLDELYRLSGSATLNGVIDGNQRKAVELLCRKAVRAFSAMLRNEIIKLRRESYRMRTAAGVEDQELERAEGSQEKAMQAFDQAVENENKLDNSAQVDPASAAELIGNLATTAEAASKPARRKRDSAQPGEDQLAGATPPEGAPAAAVTTGS